MSKRTQGKGRQARPSPPSREGANAAPRAAPPDRGEAGPDAGPAHERVAARAYQLWEARGRPEGADREHWFEAERQLRAEAP